MRLVFAAMLVLTGTALADPVRDAVKAGVERCDAVKDNRAWLNCFYGAAQPMRSSLGLTPAPQAASGPQVAPGPQAAPGSQAMASTPPPRVVPPPPQQGMFDDLFGPGVRLVQGLHIAEVRFNSDGAFVITLEDGQVWKQNSPPAAHAHFDQPPSSYVVDIRAGILGSDDLRVRGIKQTYKAHRLR